MDRVTSKVADQGGPKQETTSYTYDVTDEVPGSPDFHDGFPNVGRLTRSAKQGIRIRQNWDWLGRVAGEQWEVPNLGVYEQTTALRANGLLHWRRYPDNERIPTGSGHYIPGSSPRTGSTTPRAGSSRCPATLPISTTSLTSTTTRADR